jgi:hypothetical protein
MKNSNLDSNAASPNLDYIYEKSISKNHTQSEISSKNIHKTENKLIKEQSTETKVK